MSAIAFSPLGNNVAVAGGSSSSSASTTLPGAGGTGCMMYNSGTVPATVAFSSTPGSAVAAAASGYIVPPGITMVARIPIGTTDIAVFGVGGTPTVYAVRGDAM